MSSSLISRETTDLIHRDVREMVSSSRLVRDKSKPMVLVDRSELAVSHLLGMGAFSQVHQVSVHNRVFAMKHVRAELLHAQKDDNFRLAVCELALEAHLLASLSHPNILQIHGWAANGVASLVNGRFDSFFLLLEPLKETLEQRLARWREELEPFQQAHHIQQQQHQSLSNSNSSDSDSRMMWSQWKAGMNVNVQPSMSQPPVAAAALYSLPTSVYYAEQLDIITSIASALSYLHSVGVIYRDLKPNNIGFAYDGRVQLFDFGLSRELPSSPFLMTEPFHMSGKVGTIRYMACEVATFQPYTVSADVYSWAMVAYETLTLQKPFQGWTRDMHSELVCGQHVRPDVRLLDEHAELRPYIVASWNGIPSQRPSMHVVTEQLLMLRATPSSIAQQQQQQQQRLPAVSFDLPLDFDARKLPNRSVSASTKTTVSMSVSCHSQQQQQQHQFF